LEGSSAIDRYMAVHAALAAHEARINADVAHPAMRALALPYPVSVGRVRAGEWSSSVPDRLVFEGRVGVRVGEEPAAARAAFEAAVRAADSEEPPVEIAWTGGAFAPGETDPEHPWVRRVRAAVARERGDAPVVGVPYGADMRLFCARGIPAVMVGTSGIERAHAVDERVRVDEVVAVARIIAGVVGGGGA
jgi:acetylornithine deacetylase